MDTMSYVVSFLEKLVNTCLLYTSIGANTFQFFTRNPRGAKAKDINPEDVKQFLTYAGSHGIEKILAHAPYTLNAASADPHVREFAWNTMADDLERMRCV